MKETLSRRWLARAAIVVAALGCGVSVMPPRAALPSPGAMLAALPGPSELPSTFQASLSREAVTLVSVVAADIDADGDLDIVGSDDHLGLVVLVNDGQGHFSRQASQRTKPGLAEPDAPTVRDRGRTRTVSIQNERPTVASDTAPASELVAPEALASRRCAPAFAAAPASTRVPRAPPAALRG